MSILELRCANKLLKVTNVIINKRNLSNKTAYFTKIRRPFFLKHYPVKVVQPDGSSFTVRYFEPRKIIQLPIDLSSVTEEEKQEILENRKPKVKVVIEEEDFNDGFSSGEYLRKIKKLA